MVRQYDMTTVDMYAAYGTQFATPETTRRTSKLQNAAHLRSACGRTCCIADRLSLGDLQLASCASFDWQCYRMANGSAIELAQHSDQACLSAAQLSCV